MPDRLVSELTSGFVDADSGGRSRHLAPYIEKMPEKSGQQLPRIRSNRFATTADAHDTLHEAFADGLLRRLKQYSGRLATEAIGSQEQLPYFAELRRRTAGQRPVGGPNGGRQFRRVAAGLRG